MINTLNKQLVGVRGVIIGYIEPGETLFDAIVRLSTIAGANGQDYEIHCSRCHTTFFKEKGCLLSCQCTEEVVVGHSGDR